MMGPGLAFGRNYQATIATGGNAGLVFQWSRCPGDVGGIVLGGFRSEAGG